MRKSERSLQGDILGKIKVDHTKSLTASSSNNMAFKAQTYNRTDKRGHKRDYYT
jgi:hypothetical protein